MFGMIALMAFGAFVALLVVCALLQFLWKIGFLILGDWMWSRRKTVSNKNSEVANLNLQPFSQEKPPLL